MRNKNKIIALLLIAVLVASALLSSCGVKSARSRISDEELAQLRAKYPYNDEMGTIDLIQTWSRFQEINAPFYTYHAVVVVTLRDNWFSGSGKEVSPFDHADETAPVVTTSLRGLYCEAEVEQVLWGGEDLSAGDVIPLGFGSTMAAEMLDIENSFFSGETYICFLFQSSEEGVGTYYPTSKRTAYRLINDKILLSISSEPGIDECSGMYLDAFTKLVHETLGEPDAELTPVEPEVETQ